MNEHEHTASMRHLSWLLLACLFYISCSFLFPDWARPISDSNWKQWPLVRMFIHNDDLEHAPEEPNLLKVPVKIPERPQSSTGIMIDPKEYDGIQQSIDDPSHALDAWFASLAQTGDATKKHIARVAHYGDSSIALDGITQTMRRNLQLRFGDAGHGFMLANKGSLPYRHQDIKHSFTGTFRTVQLIQNELKTGNYGYGGIQIRGTRGTLVYGTDSDAPVGNRVSDFFFYTEQHPRGGTFEVWVDGQGPQVFSTQAETSGPGVHHVEMPDAPHEVTVKLKGGDHHLYGMAFERDVSGVIYDSLGIVGARIARMNYFDPVHLREQLSIRNPDLIILAFGGNDADDRRSTEAFKADFVAAIKLIKMARPQASCLLMSPLDQAERGADGRIRTMDTIPRIVEAIKKAAEQEHCAFFDTYHAMGGEGTMARWYKRSPKLSVGDFRHATPLGYQTIGNLFYLAMLQAFAEYQSRQAQ